MAVALDQFEPPDELSALAWLPASSLRLSTRYGEHWWVSSARRAICFCPMRLKRRGKRWTGWDRQINVREYVLPISDGQHVETRS